jgi:hypothetical protein
MFTDVEIILRSCCVNIASSARNGAQNIEFPLQGAEFS